MAGLLPNVAAAFSDAIYSPSDPRATSSAQEKLWRAIARSLQWIIICCLLICCPRKTLAQEDFVLHLVPGNSGVAELQFEGAPGWYYSLEQAQSLTAAFSTASGWIAGYGQTASWLIYCPIQQEAAPESEGTVGETFTLYPFGHGSTLVTWPAADGTLHRVYIAQDLSGLPPLLTLPEIEGSPAMLLLFGAISWDPNYEALSADLLPLEQQFQLGHLIGRIPEIRQTSFNGGAGAGLAPTGPQKFFRVRRMPFDADGDSLSWEEEVMIYGTNPDLADTDGDGMSDLDEIISGTNPAVSNIIAQKLRVVVPDRENDRSSPNDGNIELRWEPPTGPNFTEVQVQQSTNGGFWETLATLAKTISTYPPRRCHL